MLIMTGKRGTLLGWRMKDTIVMQIIVLSVLGGPNVLILVLQSCNATGLISTAAIQYKSICFRKHTADNHSLIPYDAKALVLSTRPSMTLPTCPHRSIDSTCPAPSKATNSTLTSLRHSHIHSPHQLLRKLDLNHLIAAAMTNPDPPPPNPFRQLGNLLGRFPMAARRDSLQNETFAREAHAVLPLRELLGGVPVGVCGELAFRVGGFEKWRGEEAGAGAGNGCVEGARDEDFETLLEALEEALAGWRGVVSLLRNQNCLAGLG